jgi:integrase
VEDCNVTRKVRDSALETRTARARLVVAHKPYFRLIEPGLHVGYRKLASGPGTWIVRRYAGDGKYTVKNLMTDDGRLIVADDFSEPNGQAVLSFGQARELAKAHRGTSTVDSGPYLVGTAMDDYLNFLRGEGRSEAAVKDAAYRIDAFIRPTLGDFEVATLTAAQLRRWRADLAKASPRLRSEGKQKFRPNSDDRARKATANRILTTLKAALNHAFDEEKVSSNKAWGRRVKPFEDVESARVRYLQLDEAKRLINASDREFRPMVEAALQTGARYSEVARLRAADFNEDAGTVFVAMSKGGKARHIVLSAEGVAFFRRACMGRPGDGLIFTNKSGAPWGKSHQSRPMKAACSRAKIKPAISFHGLRHTWASLMVKSGAPLHVVAKNLGHVTKDGQPDVRMVTRHYAHFEDSFVADSIRQHAPKFGFTSDKKVRSLKVRAP